MRDISNRQLLDKAVVLKGKKYVQVVDRIRFFNENFPGGSIRTEITNVINDKTYVVKATVSIPAFAYNLEIAGEKRPMTRDVEFTGHSQATMGGSGANKEAALENAETSAVGRALGMMCIGVIDSVASIDEMKKAKVEGAGAIEIDDVF
jgi:hypothetical protein